MLTNVRKSRVFDPSLVSTWIILCTSATNRFWNKANEAHVAMADPISPPNPIVARPIGISFFFILVWTAVTEVEIPMPIAKPRIAKQANTCTVLSTRNVELM